MGMAVYYSTITFPLDVFTQGNVVADFIRLKLNYCILRNKKSLYDPLSGDLLHGNVRTPSIARWKAGGRLLFVIIELFRYLLQLRRYKQKSVEVDAFWRIESLWAQIWDGRGRRPPATVGVSKLEWLPFRVVSKYPQCIVWFWHKACVW